MSDFLEQESKTVCVCVWGGGGPCTYIPDMKYEQIIP